MKLPSQTIVVDSSIIVAAVRGRSAEVLSVVANRHELITSERAAVECRRRVGLSLDANLLPQLEMLLDLISVKAPETYLDRLDAAEVCLREAVTSCNGSTKDAHLVSVAWNSHSDIWSSDRDFAGTGIATWSTPNLLRAITAKISTSTA